MPNNLDRLLQSKSTTKTKLLNVQLPEELHTEFKEVCKDVEHPMSNILEAMIRDFVEKRQLESVRQKRSGSDRDRDGGGAKPSLA